LRAAVTTARDQQWSRSVRGDDALRRPAAKTPVRAFQYLFMMTSMKSLRNLS
jgi:hypothetical protein